MKKALTAKDGWKLNLNYAVKKLGKK